MYYNEYEPVIRPSRNKSFPCSCGKIHMLDSSRPNYCSECGVELKDVFSSKRKEYLSEHDEYMKNLLNRRERFKHDLFKHFNITEEGVFAISVGKLFDIISDEVGRDAFEEIHDTFGFWIKKADIKE